MSFHKVQQILKAGNAASAVQKPPLMLFLATVPLRITRLLMSKNISVLLVVVFWVSGSYCMSSLVSRT